MPINDKSRTKRPDNMAAEVVAIAESVIKNAGKTGRRTAAITRAPIVYGDLQGDGSGGGGSGALVFIAQTPAGGSMVYGTLAGAVNGSNTTYTVPESSYTSGALKVWRNGVLQTQGSDQSWQETSPVAGTFDFVTAPLTGDHIIAEYI